MKNMRKFIAPILVILLTACAVKFPQSPEEFVSYYSGGPGMGQKINSSEVNRSYRTVMDAIEEYSSTCINNKIIVTTIKQGMYYSKTKTEYRTKISKSPNGTSFFSVQLLPDHMQKGVHPDGFYSLVSEIKPIGDSKTSITTYYIWGSEYENMIYYLKEWAAGKSKDCPLLAVSL